jgi:cytochrome P450
MNGRADTKSCGSQKLETLDLVMNESLRLVTPLPLNMRQTARDTDLLGYYLPAGTNVSTWPGMNHWLPELWTEPKKFDPERLTEPEPSTSGTAALSRPSAVVFGQLEIKTVIHRLLRKYRLEVTRPDYKARWD